MPKGIPNKRYTGEFKQLVVETMMREKLSYIETRKRFDIAGEDRVRSWKRIYLTEGAEGLYIERQGRASTGRSRNLPKETEEDLLAEVQRLRAENAYQKNCKPSFRKRATPSEKVTAIQELRQEHPLAMLLEIAQLPRATFYYQLKGWTCQRGNYGNLKATQGDTGHAEIDMITSIYAHILDEDRKINAQKFENQFYAPPDLRNVRAPGSAVKVEEKSSPSLILFSGGTASAQSAVVLCTGHAACSPTG